MLAPAPFPPETVGQITYSIVASLNAITKMANLDTELKPEDYTYEKNFEVLRKSWKKSVRVIAYAPKVFYQIRKFNGIHEDAFVESWNLSEENLTTKGGAGRSGSLFGHSQDKRYIFKTVYEDEKDMLLNILPSYFEHIRENPSSLLQRMYGIYSFEHIKSFVLVFGNLLYSPQGPPEAIFDLKGREVKPGHQGLKDDEKVMKDKNLERKFRFSELMHDQVFHHLEIDVNLLRRSNIMDYSLLIGIRKASPVDPPPRDSVNPPPLNFRSVSIFQQTDGGFRGGSKSQDDDEYVYHIGIIDCLTNYGLRKKLANFCKSMRWRVESLSTVDADFYADRFLKFMHKILVVENTPGANDPPVLNMLPPPSSLSGAASSLVSPFSNFSLSSTKTPTPLEAPTTPSTSVACASATPADPSTAVAKPSS